MRPETQRQIREFDCMRAVAILLILVHHLPGHIFNFYDLRNFAIPLDLSVLNDLNRYFALGIFIFISGFVLVRSHVVILCLSDVRNFLIKRYIRIIPLYVVALLIFVILFKELLAPMNAFSFVVHLLGLQLLLASPWCEPVFTLWYVGLIMAYYFFYLFLARYGRSLMGCLIIAFCAASISLFIMISFGWIDKRFILYLAPFMAGIIAARVNLLEKIKPWQVFLTLMLWITSSWFYATFIYPIIAAPVSKPGLFSVVGLAALCLSNVIMLSIILPVYRLSGYVLQTRIMSLAEKISYASYAMFLFHRPVWWVMGRIWHPSSPLFQLVYMIGLGIPLIVLISYIIQKSYDLYPAQYLRSLVN